MHSSFMPDVDNKRVKLMEKVFVLKERPSFENAAREVLIALEDGRNIVPSTGVESDDSVAEGEYYFFELEHCWEGLHYYCHFEGELRQLQVVFDARE